MIFFYNFPMKIFNKKYKIYLHIIQSNSITNKQTNIQTNKKNPFIKRQHVPEDINELKRQLLRTHSQTFNKKTNLIPSKNHPYHHHTQNDLFKRSHDPQTIRIDPGHKQHPRSIAAANKQHGCKWVVQLPTPGKSPNHGGQLQFWRKLPNHVPWTRDVFYRRTCHILKWRIPTRAAFLGWIVSVLFNSLGSIVSCLCLF